MSDKSLRSPLRPKETEQRTLRPGSKQAPQSSRGSPLLYSPALATTCPAATDELDPVRLIRAGDLGQGMCFLIRGGWFFALLWREKKKKKKQKLAMEFFIYGMGRQSLAGWLARLSRLA